MNILRAYRKKRDNYEKLKILELIKKAHKTGDWTPVEQADVSKVKHMGSMFADIKSIANLDLSGWDTSNVTNMERMFANSDINHPSIGNFDTSKVRNMSHMFSNCQYNQPLYFDTSNVTNMDEMFRKSSYDYPLQFDTSNVETMSHMFEEARYSYPLDSFDFSSVRNVVGICGFKDLAYVHPIRHIDTLSREALGFEYMMHFDRRNRRLQRFLETGECDDISALMDDFSDNEKLMSIIRHAHLKHSGSTEQSLQNCIPLPTRL